MCQGVILQSLHQIAASRPWLPTDRFASSSSSQQNWGIRMDHWELEERTASPNLWSMWHSNCWACLNCWPNFATFTLCLRCVVHSKMYLKTITKHPSIHIPILNPKSFMVINSELKVAPSVFSPPPFKAPPGGLFGRKNLEDHGKQHHQTQLLGKKHHPFSQLKPIIQYQGSVHKAWSILGLTIQLAPRMVLQLLMIRFRPVAVQWAATSPWFPSQPLDRRSNKTW